MQRALPMGRACSCSSCYPLPSPLPSAPLPSTFLSPFKDKTPLLWLWSSWFPLVSMVAACGRRAATWHQAWPSPVRRCRCSRCRRGGSRRSSARMHSSHQSGPRWLWGSPGLLSVWGSSFCAERKEEPMSLWSWGPWLCAPISLSFKVSLLSHPTGAEVIFYRNPRVGGGTTYFLSFPPNSQLPQLLYFWFATQLPLNSIF